MEALPECKAHPGDEIPTVWESVARRAESDGDLLTALRVEGVTLPDLHRARARDPRIDARFDEVDGALYQIIGSALIASAASGNVRAVKSIAAGDLRALAGGTTDPRVDELALLMRDSTVLDAVRRARERLDLPRSNLPVSPLWSEPQRCPRCGGWLTVEVAEPGRDSRASLKICTTVEEARLTYPPPAQGPPLPGRGSGLSTGEACYVGFGR